MKPRISFQAFIQFVPILFVPLDQARPEGGIFLGSRQRILVELENDPKRFQVRIHPGNDIAFLNIK